MDKTGPNEEAKVDSPKVVAALGREDALGEGIEIVLRAEEAGKPPDLVPWLARNPHLAGELAGFLAAHRGIQSEVQILLTGNGQSPLDDKVADKKLGGLEIRQEIDRGGMGVVYRAYDPVLRREVAVKRVLAGSLCSSDERARFRFEAEAAAGLNHPAVVPIHAFGEEDGNPYLVMALMEGGSLAKRLRERGGEPGYPPLEAAALIRDLALGVHHAHQRGLLHRDLKPANILFDEHDRPHIADFGLALALEATISLSMAHNITGTAAYMSPEQVTGGKSLTTAVDTHALGVILYELLAGKPPFACQEWLLTLQKVRDEEPPPLREARPNVPRDLETICQRCLEKDPADRYPSAQALADDLDRFLQGEPLIYRRPSWAAGLSRVLSRRRLTTSMGSWPFGYILAVLALLTHGLITWIVVVGAWGGWAYALLGLDLAGWVFLYGWYLLARLQSLTPVERQSAALQCGTMLACVTLVPGLLLSHGWHVPGLLLSQGWDVLFLYLYPPLTTVRGLGLFAHGATHWGRFYVMGIVRMLVGSLMPLFHPFTWPAIYCAAIVPDLVWIGYKLRQFDLESRKLNGQVVSGGKGGSDSDLTSISG